MIIYGIPFVIFYWCWCAHNTPLLPHILLPYTAHFVLVLHSALFFVPPFVYATALVIFTTFCALPPHLFPIAFIHAVTPCLSRTHFHTRPVAFLYYRTSVCTVLSLRFRSARSMQHTGSALQCGCVYFTFTCAWLHVSITYIFYWARVAILILWLPWHYCHHCAFYFGFVSFYSVPFWTYISVLVPLCRLHIVLLFWTILPTHTDITTPAACCHVSTLPFLPLHFLFLHIPFLLHTCIPYTTTTLYHTTFHSIPLHSAHFLFFVFCLFFYHLFYHTAYIPSVEPVACSC